MRQALRSGTALLAVAFLLAAACNSAAALRPTDAQRAYEIPLPGTALQSPASETAQAARVALERRFGGTWKVHSWNPHARTPHAIYGSGAPVASALASPVELEEIARQIVGAHPGVFRADLRDLRLDQVSEVPGKQAVHFQQTYHGLDVWGGRVHLTFTREGRLFAMGSDFYPGIHVDPQPTLSAERAAQLARDGLPFDPRMDRVEAPAELLVLPVPRGASDVDYHLVWRVRVHTRAPLGIWVSHVDAHSGEIVWRYNDIHFADFSGGADSEIEPWTWCNGMEVEPLAYVEVEVDGVGTDVTACDGSWTIPYGGSDERQLTVALVGPYVRVLNQAGGNALYEAMVTPGEPHQVSMHDWWAQRDERDCFDAVNDVHDFIFAIDPGFPLIQQQMICNVSLDATCNAYWDGTINFYRAGDGCANTGQIQGVVHHEYGHGIQHAILGWQGDQGLGEGNADIIANLITQESIIGRGFYLSDCEGGIRDSDNDLIYPDDVIGQEIHYAGQVIAGFHWDFMTRMQDLYGQEAGTLYASELWHFCRILEQPTLQPDQVLAAFIYDDDDGDLTNGTPHYDDLCYAATHHGFDCPEVLAGVQIDHEPLWTMTEEGSAEVIATVWSVDAEMDPDSVLVRYSLNGGEMVELQMDPMGPDDLYHAFIPNLTYGDMVGYYLRGVDLLGNAANHPEAAPEELHEFGVATVFDPLEEESGWVVNLEGTDTAERGIWVREDPVGTRAQPEDDHTADPGVLCWVTGNGPPGYPPGAYDVDHGVTSLYTPVYDLTGSESALAAYWRWYSNDGDANPRQDYWGAWVRNNGCDWVEIEYTNEEDMNQWVRRDFDLSAAFGEQLGEVQFKFAAADTGGLSMVEACVDDLEIIARMGAGDAPEHPSDPGAPRFAFSGGRSVPVVHATDLRFALPAAAPVEIVVYDVGGRAVRTVADGVFAAGTHNVPWDVRDDRGRPVSAGVYYCRLETPGFRATRTLVVAR
ncbi:MAG: hypothetical protein GF330_10260 [Candidatus Eisenbacteria bacterium]|nr:hypothetical protein [Candidatus Eisenbacteria bacterium]